LRLRALSDLRQWVRPEQSDRFFQRSGGALFGWPKFTHPVFTASAVGLIAPVAIVLVAENLVMSKP
jgi:hypothetical protein